MRKWIFLLIVSLQTLILAEYQIGEVCENISWTDSDGLTTSIYEQVDEGKAVMIFWGQSW